MLADPNECDVPVIMHELEGQPQRAKSGPIVNLCMSQFVLPVNSCCLAGLETRDICAHICISWLSPCCGCAYLLT